MERKIECLRRNLESVEQEEVVARLEAIEASLYFKLNRLAFYARQTNNEPHNFWPVRTLTDTEIHLATGAPAPLIW